MNIFSDLVITIFIVDKIGEIFTVIEVEINPIVLNLWFCIAKQGKERSWLLKSRSVTMILLNHSRDLRDL